MLSENTVALAQGANLGLISTMLPSGLIHNQPVWVDTDGDNILVNTEVDRRKAKNVEADSTATVTIVDADTPWHWTEVRGRVVRMDKGPDARAHIDKLAKVYMGVDDYPNPIESERVILVIEPDQVFEFPPAG